MNYTNLITILTILILLFLIKNIFFKGYEAFSLGNTNEMLNNYYKGKVILITGSTNGIGLSLAKTFSKLECNLVIHGRDEKKVNDTITLLNSKYYYYMCCVMLKAKFRFYVSTIFVY